MCLVSRDGTAVVRPLGPLLGEVVEQHVAQGLAVVAHHLGIAVKELGELVLQLVAVRFFKLREEGG